MTSNSIVKYLLIIVAVGLISCTTDNRITGGSGSTTTNGFTAMVRDFQGRVVAGALVRVRPHDYLKNDTGFAESSNGKRLFDTTTGADGRIVVYGMHPDTYTVEIVHESAGEGTIFRSAIGDGPAAECGVRTTIPVGAINGAIDTTLIPGSASYSVVLFGVERSSPIDPQTGAYTIAALPPENYALRIVTKDTIMAPVDLDTITVTSGKTSNVGPLDLWKHQGIISIDIPRAGLSNDDTLFNFPLLLRLTRDNFDFSTAKKKGGDLRITKNDGVPVSFDTDWWDSASATAIIWINIDTLFGNSAKKTLNCHWGNSRSTSVSRPNAVFDTIFGFQGVWHLNESGGTVQKDATANQQNGTPYGMDGANDISGLTGRAQRFDGDVTKIDFTLSTDLFQSTLSTISLWVKIGTTPTADRVILNDRHGRFGLFVNKDGWFVARNQYNSSESSMLTDAASFGGWTHITAVRQGTVNRLYVNGLSADSGTIETVPVDEPNDGSFTIGCLADSTGWLDGVIDEMRMHDAAVSPAWIRCSYETQRENQQAVTMHEVQDVE